MDVDAVPVKLPVITPLFIVTPEIAVAEATYKLPPIPTPPLTISVPDVVDTELSDPFPILVKPPNSFSVIV